MERQQTAEKTATGEVSVLVADDQVPLRELLKAVLRTLRITNMDCIGDGKQAVEMYRQSRHDIVFLDIDMPGQDGFSALSEIMQIEPKAFVVMVSGHSAVDNIKKSLELGAKGFVVKPYTSSKIGDMLKKFRDSHR